ncbi:MAG: hypothetical protein JOZ96_21730 [Acidobacteria bacterium]|nr:hypothetical protein [Acidobacteriota bacterium]
MNEWMAVHTRYATPRPRRTVREFWRRQFGGAPTRAQRRFDVTFGVILPVLCFVFDPFVFSGRGEYGGGLYPQCQLYVYTLSALEMVALCAWLLFAAGRRPAALAGVLFAGALFSFVVGLAILPFSLLGLLFIIGVLGFVPFLTAFVYLRNGWRAACSVSHAGVGLSSLTALAFAFGFFFALGAPAVARVSVKNEVEAAMKDVCEGEEISPARLRALRAAAAVSGSSAYDEIAWEYYGEPDAYRRARLAKCYAEVTVGGDIKRRLEILLD